MFLHGISTARRERAASVDVGRHQEGLRRRAAGGTRLPIVIRTEVMTELVGDHESRLRRSAEILTQADSRHSAERADVGHTQRIAVEVLARDEMREAASAHL